VLEPGGMLTVAVPLTIVEVKVGSDSLTITLQTSRQGTVTISGVGLKMTTTSVVVGTNEIRVSLTKDGKHDRKHHKNIKLTIELKAAGKTVSESKTVKL
jgi:hypothetical protein